MNTKVKNSQDNSEQSQLEDLPQGIKGCHLATVQK